MTGYARIRAGDLGPADGAAWRRVATAAIALAAALLLLVPLSDPRADDGRQLEHRVKATFLYRFLEYTEWPPDMRPGADGAIGIGVIGADDVAATLKQYAADAGTGGRPVRVRRLTEGESLGGLHMLFVDRSQRSRSTELSRAAQQRGLLVVGDWEGALDQGAAINFVLRDGRVRFEVSLPAAQQAGIRFSARMLAVATHVRTGLQ